MFLLLEKCINFQCVMNRWSGVLQVQLYPNSSTFYRVAASLGLSSSPKNLSVPSGNVIFFNGDRADGTGNPVIERLSDPLKIAEILVSKFGGSINAYVVEASVFNGPFAVYKDFIPSVNENGEPKTYDATGFPASTSVVLLLSKFLGEAKNVILGKQKEPYQSEASSSSSIPETAILGFSKGGIILNQLLTELSFSETQKNSRGVNTQENYLVIPTSKESLLSSISEIHYVDVGLNSSGAYLTDKDVIDRISERLSRRASGIRFFFHGTPRQWSDERRIWIRKEKDALVRLLKRAAAARKDIDKLLIRERLYFPSKLPNLQMHFEIIEILNFISENDWGKPFSKLQSKQSQESSISRSLGSTWILLKSSRARVISTQTRAFTKPKQLVYMQACYDEWRGAANESEKKESFIKSMKKNVNINKLDDSTLIAGIVTPPVPMAAKKAWESLPQLKLMKTIPDVIFVPTATCWLSSLSTYPGKCFSVILLT
ncbi:hypothetical protein F511_29402 [Dorcoceras hygrometricum]|uniref:Uncharacterized protein n=1 Tax=Dorcoceras hygrometricum TaxID=472368 RepID=A0A2Z7CDE7_9LAMI|nr:hypothetical protein F511_29402 [Dorcoceras hygrometricum]